ncbi:MAG: LysR substrate-binding domain-containing protein, partial [Paracoccaceae bacterium]
KEPSQADLIRKRLMFVRIGLYATREYIERHGAPETLDDMKNHRLIFQNPKSPQVLAGQNLVRELMTYEIGSTLTVNNYFGVLQAAIHNLGIGMLPDYVTHAIDTMVRVLPDVESMEVPVYLAYPEELRHSKRIEAFRDFVEKEILEDKRKSRQEVSP